MAWVSSFRQLLGGEPAHERGVSSLDMRAIAIGGDELGDRFAVRGYDVAASLTDTAKELGEFTIGICGGYGFFHGGTNSSDITYYTAYKNSRLEPQISQQA
jgi:hypothetical protein